MITIRNYLLFEIAHSPARVSCDRQLSRRGFASSDIPWWCAAVVAELVSEEENRNQYAVGNMNDIFN